MRVLILPTIAFLTCIAGVAASASSTPAPIPVVQVAPEQSMAPNEVPVPEDTCDCCCEYDAGYGSIHHECTSTSDSCTDSPISGKCVDRSKCP